MQLTPMQANNRMTALEIETPQCSVVITERDTGVTEIEIRSVLTDSTLIHTIRGDSTQTKVDEGLKDESSVSEFQ